MLEDLLEKSEPLCWDKIDCCHEVCQDVAYPFLGNELSSQEKINAIEYHFKEILITLGMDMDDDSLQKTPQRYAKMFVNELFCGLNENSFPEITTQENKFNYNQPLIESHISIQSVCEHHFIPFLGYCHISYIPEGRVIGLSKLNRIAKYYARRPQVQERMTKQIRMTLSHVLQTQDVAVVIDALHLCVRMRGVQDQEALTRTMDLSGAFLEESVRKEFLASIPKLSEFKF